MKKTIILGTRGSALALAQAAETAAAIEALSPGIEIEQKIIETTGDNRLGASLTDSPGVDLDKGLFTKEIEEALLVGQIDFAVHSLKDLPTTLPTGLELAGVLPRADIRDVAIFTKPVSCESLPKGAVLGTSSIRRSTQLLERYPHLTTREIRGNVPTRLDKLIDGQVDGLILAAAGLVRLGYGLESTVHHKDSVLHLELLDWMLPAVGQGAIAIEIRSGDTKMADIVKKIHHDPTRLAVEAERALLRHLGGGCQVALGVRTTLTEEKLQLEAVWFRGGATAGRRVVHTDTPKAGPELAARAAVDLMSGAK